MEGLSKLKMKIKRDVLKVFSSKIIQSTVFACLLIVSLSGCTSVDSIFGGKYPVGSIWDVPDINHDGMVEWEDASSVSQEQHLGFLFASENLANLIFDQWVSYEGNRQDDVQVAIRDMVELGEADDSPTPVVAIMGATSNEATMRAAAIANFFNVPMVVPTANGDNLFPSNNLWAFRLSASGSDYANFIFHTIISELKNSGKLESSSSITELKIGIIYEANTFGESAAVATAKIAMEQSIEIGVYEKFPAINPDPEYLSEIIAELQKEKVNFVYLVSSDPNAAISLVQVLVNDYQDQLMPIVIGQAGGFASLEFLESPEAESVFIVRQELVSETCPSEFTSIVEAQTYSAAFLINRAIELANENPKISSDSSISLSLSKEIQLNFFRESIRDVLKDFNELIPCMGRVSFENSGELKAPQFEILVVEEGDICICANEVLLDAMAIKLE